MALVTILHTVRILLETQREETNGEQNKKKKQTQTPKTINLLHEAPQQFDGQGEDDGGVLLGGDGVEGLQVSQLEGGRRLRDDVGRLLQSDGGLLLALGRNHLQAREKPAVRT